MEFLSVSLEFLRTSTLSIVLCIVAYLALGMIWYGPLFGKKWMHLVGVNTNVQPSMKNMMEPILTSAFTAAVQGCILGALFLYFAPVSIIEAKIIATLLWLGFSGGSVLTNYAWAMKPVSLRLIDGGFTLVTLNVFAAIIFMLG